MRRVFTVSLLLVPALVLAGCGGGSDSSDAAACTEVAAPTPGTRLAPMPTAKLDEARVYTVTFETNCGSFTVTLDQKQSPNAAASLYSLAKRGYYEGTIFHRIVPGTLFQGGDPSATGNEGPGYTTVDPPPTDAAYRLGVVAMGRNGGDPVGAGGSQFFVVTTVDAGFSPDFAVVGHVTAGLDVVAAIGQLGGPDGVPTQVVEIEKATALEH